MKKTKIIKSLSGERWKIISHQRYKHRYMISNKGRLKTIDRCREKLMKASSKFSGKVNRLTVRLNAGGKSKEYYLDALMLRTFKGLKKHVEYIKILYRDGNPNNCVLANLKVIKI